MINKGTKDGKPEVQGTESALQEPLGVGGRAPWNVMVLRRKVSVERQAADCDAIRGDVAIRIEAMEVSRQGRVRASVPHQEFGRAETQAMRGEDVSPKSQRATDSARRAQEEHIISKSMGLSLALFLQLLKHGPNCRSEGQGRQWVALRNASSSDQGLSCAQGTRSEGDAGPRQPGILGGPEDVIGIRSTWEREMELKALQRSVRTTARSGS